MRPAVRTIKNTYINILTMEALDKKYQKVIDDVAKKIQASDELATYLDTEEYDDYKALIDAYEPTLQELYDEAAGSHPLQLEALEKAMLTEELEGLYLSKIVGYAVLRGEVNESCKYRFPQDHFKDVVMALAHSSNFEMIKQRVGLSIQIGFALSSDIWITNIIESITNKKVKYFLESQKLHKYRDVLNRKEALRKYRKQFESLNFLTSDFPQTYGELKTKFHQLRTFLQHRIKADYDNSTLLPHIKAFINNKELIGHDEYIRILTLIGMYFTTDAQTKKDFSTSFRSMASGNNEFTEAYMELLDELHQSEAGVTAEADKNISALIKDHSSKGIKEYYTLTDTVHSKGCIHEDTIEAVRKYYEQHEGLSTENECLRYTILNYFENILGNLSTADYADYFELNKTFVLYMSIFSNQKFNQAVKEYSVSYIKKLKKAYPDKRGRDYQDIKKFVKTTFLDLGFMSDKELVEFFKTKRKPKPTA